MAREAVRVVGRWEAQRTIFAICSRLEHPELASESVWELYEEEYEGRFNRWFPYLYETGATYEAWTDSDALGAVRRFHGGGIEFGSSIDYNRFFARDLLARDNLTEERIAEALAYYFVPPDADEVKPVWWRPRDPTSGRFLKLGTFGVR